MFRRTKWFTRESSLRLSSLVLQDKTSCNKIGCKTRLIYRLPNVYLCMLNAILKPVKERNLEHPLRCLMLILVEMLLYNGYKLMHRTERRDNTGGHCDNCQHGTPASRSSREKLHLLLIHSCPQPPTAVLAHARKSPEWRWRCYFHYLVTAVTDTFTFYVVQMKTPTQSGVKRSGTFNVKGTAGEKNPLCAHVSEVPLLLKFH